MNTNFPLTEKQYLNGLIFKIVRQNMLKTDKNCIFIYKICNKRTKQSDKTTKQQTTKLKKIVQINESTKIKTKKNYKKLQTKQQT